MLFFCEIAIIAQAKTYLMRVVVLCLCALFTIAFQACQKEVSIDTIVAPTDTLQETDSADSSFLPHSIAVLSPDPDDNNFVLSLKYLSNEHQIQVYLDDTTTANPYDSHLLTYFYNNAGYFMKREWYDATGKVTESFSAARESDNTLKTIIAWNNNPDNTEILRDTFAISVADSAGAPSYKIMTVANNYIAGTELVNVRNELTFENNRLFKARGGRFDGSQGLNIFIPPYALAYDAQGRLATRSISNYYGTAYSYENTGRSLDSFFRVLGGKDGHLLNIDGLWSFQANAEFDFFPLYIILSSMHTELYAQMHRDGVLKQVRSIPNGTQFPYTETFDFANTFDAQQRVTETVITTNGRIYTTWKFKY